MEKKSNYVSVKIVLKPKNKILTSIHKGFCKGCYLICRSVKDFGSVNYASKHYGIAYYKAWKLKNDVENDFGKKLIINKNGVPADGSELTDDGKKLVTEYEECVKIIEEALRKRGYNVQI